MKNAAVNQKRLKRVLVEVALGLALGSILSLLLWFNFLSDWQRRGADLLYTRDTPTGGQVVIVAVDDRSLAELGLWDRWPRSNHAQLVDILQAAGARVIGLDFLLAESSPDDSHLVDSFRRAGNVVLPLAGTLSSPRKAVSGQPMRFDAFLKPNPELLAAAAAIGHVNALPDPDSIVRRISARIAADEGDENAPSFALAVVARYLRLPAVDYMPRNGAIGLAGRRIPVDQFESMLIRFAGPPSRPGVPSTFPVYSYSDVLRGGVNPSVFHDKIVLVGVMASGMLDSHPIPLSGEKMYGVEIFANVVDSVVNNRFLSEQGLPGQFALILLVAVIGAIVLSRFHPAVASLVCAGLVLSYGVVASWFFQRGLLLNVVYPPLALVAVYVAVIINRYVAEARRHRHLTDLFGRYVSRDVLNAVLISFDAGTLQLGGADREATVLFADIRGFSDLAENIPPSDVMAVLNTYLSALVQVIDRHQGTVNKFVGDSVMATWNAPLDQPDHAWRAVCAARDMQAVVAQIRSGHPNVPVVTFGIGINSGQMVAGNVGAEQRMEYTVIGDAVNVASRLCDAARPGEILIGGRTYALVGHAVAAEERPVMTFRAGAQPGAAYCLAD
jgi:adenylate cyclase